MHNDTHLQDGEFLDLMKVRAMWRINIISYSDKLNTRRSGNIPHRG